MGLGRDLGTHMKPSQPLTGIGCIVALLALKFRSELMLFAAMGMVVADGVMDIVTKRTGAGAKIIVLGALAVGIWFIWKGAFNGGDYNLLGQFANWLNNFLSGP